MENIPLHVEKRETTGSGKLNRIRHSGYIPGVIYGMGMENTPVQIKESLLCENLRHHGVNTIFNVDLDGNAQTVVIRELQVDKLKKGYVHVDLQRISPNQKREAKVPIRIAGKGRKESRHAVFIQQLEHITVKGLPREIPEYIEVTVSDMKSGDTLTVEQLILPENLVIANQPDEIIVSLSPTRAVAEDLNPKDDTSADEVPLIGNDERKTNAT